MPVWLLVPAVRAGVTLPVGRSAPRSQGSLSRSVQHLAHSHVRNDCGLVSVVVGTGCRELAVLSTGQAVNVLQVLEMFVAKIPPHIAHMYPLTYDQNQQPPDTRYRDRKEQGWGNFCLVQWRRTSR